MYIGTLPRLEVIEILTLAPPFGNKITCRSIGIASFSNHTDNRVTNSFAATGQRLAPPTAIVCPASCCGFSINRAHFGAVPFVAVGIERSKEPVRFTAFELAGWDANIDGYDQAFGDVSRQTVEPLLDAANVTVDLRVLDVCCGPGMLVEGALQRGAEAVGIDFSSEAVGLARRLVPGGNFQQAFPAGRCTSLALSGCQFRCCAVWIWPHACPRSGVGPA